MRGKDICGACFNVNGKEARQVARRLYENIRNRKMDCYKIYKNVSSSFSVDQIQVIKNYIFKDSHFLLDNGEYKFIKFYPTYDIAESWLRLAGNKPENILKHDILLLYHELTEIKILLDNPGYTQDFAHGLANKKYSYQLASDEYYRKLGRL